MTFAEAVEEVETAPGDWGMDEYEDDDEEEEQPKQIPLKEVGHPKQIPRKHSAQRCK